MLQQIMMYPLADYDGTMKRMDWHARPSLPNPDTGEAETNWVPPATFFDILPQALADALDGWLTDKTRADALEKIFTDMHLQLRQDTATKAAAAILPYLRGSR